MLELSRKYGKGFVVNDGEDVFRIDYAGINPDDKECLVHVHGTRKEVACLIDGRIDSSNQGSLTSWLPIDTKGKLHRIIVPDTVGFYLYEVRKQDTAVFVFEAPISVRIDREELYFRKKWTPSRLYRVLSEKLDEKVLAYFTDSGRTNTEIEALVHANILTREEGMMLSYYVRNGFCFQTNRLLIKPPVDLEQIDDSYECMRAMFAYIQNFIENPALREAIATGLKHENMSDHYKKKLKSIYRAIAFDGANREEPAQKTTTHSA